MNDWSVMAIVSWKKINKIHRIADRSLIDTMPILLLRYAVEQRLVLCVCIAFGINSHIARITLVQR